VGSDTPASPQKIVKVEKIEEKTPQKCGKVEKKGWGEHEYITTAYEMSGCDKNFVLLLVQLALLYIT
jgi:hypothetical protein